MPFVLKNFWYVNMGKPQLNEIFNTADFVRFSQIEKILMNDNLPNGSIAELGVYRGRLTKLLAKVASQRNRQLFLFDTFSGFNSADMKTEKENGLNTYFENFAGTDVSKIHRICISAGMPANNIKIKSGWFPESLDEEASNESFAFVSLDFDLYKPTIDALNRLYDNVTDGGFIAVHDYGNKRYKGVKKATDEFVEQRDIKFCLELCDYCGTMLIKKVKQC